MRLRSLGVVCGLVFSQWMMGCGGGGSNPPSTPITITTTTLSQGNEYCLQCDAGGDGRFRSSDMVPGQWQHSPRTNAERRGSNLRNAHDRCTWQFHRECSGLRDRPADGECTPQVGDQRRNADHHPAIAGCRTSRCEL